jgi:hypothetical protein
VTTGRAGRLAIQVKAGESVSAGTPLAQILE